MLSSDNQVNIAVLCIILRGFAEHLPKIYSKDLIEILFRLPYTKRQHLINQNIGNLKTVT
jgi:hypothetical protein